MSSASVATNVIGPFQIVLGEYLGRRRIFAVWLCLFYAAWAGIVLSGGLWSLVRTNLPISVAMAGGSFVAGSSPVAGGTVGFPVLVYMFGHPARLGRNFSMTIQSIGMVSASIYILTHRRRVEWRILRFALIGAAAGMPLGMIAVAPRLGDFWVKLLFSIVYASFGLLHMARTGEIVNNEGPSRTYFRGDPAIGLTVGFLGGLLASVIGVGADILLYGILVLLYHTDIKIAIPSAVILMAFTSLVGTTCLAAESLCFPASRSLVFAAFPYWLAAAPVVVLGGPLGSVVSRYVPRRSLLGFVAILCLAQYAWTCAHEHIAGYSLFISTLGVLGVNLVLHALFLFGRRCLPEKGPDR